MLPLMQYVLLFIPTSPSSTSTLTMREPVALPFQSPHFSSTPLPTIAELHASPMFCWRQWALRLVKCACMFKMRGTISRARGKEENKERRKIYQICKGTSLGLESSNIGFNYHTGRDRSVRCQTAVFTHLNTSFINLCDL